MAKKEKNKPQAQAPPVPPAREKEANFLTMFSKLDSQQKHRILAYLFWLLGIFIILFAYRAS